MLRSLRPPPGSIIPSEPSETHAVWLYIIMIIFARVSSSGATAVGSSGNLWFAVFTSLYLTSSSAASSFDREAEDARAESGFMSGSGFYLNFSRSTVTQQLKFSDSLEHVSVLISQAFSVGTRLFKLRLRYLLGYGTWASSAPWQMAPGVVLSFWAAAIYTAEPVGHFKAFHKKETSEEETRTWKKRLFVRCKIVILVSSLACVGLGGASIITAYRGVPAASNIRWMAYGVAEFHSWHAGFYQFAMDKVHGPDIWFAASSTLAADPGDSLVWRS